MTSRHAFLGHVRMFLGHLGTAAYFASKDRRIPLWWYVLASLMPDVGFVVLAAADVESFRAIGGPSAGMYGWRFGFDWSHSLVVIAGMALAVALIVGRRVGARSGVLIGYATLIHWPLDALMHRPELALLPGNAFGLPRFGIGLWQVGWLALAIELVIVATGAVHRYQEHTAAQRLGRWAVSVVSMMIGAAILLSFARIAALLAL